MYYIPWTCSKISSCDEMHDNKDNRVQIHRRNKSKTETEFSLSFEWYWAISKIFSQVFFNRTIVFFLWHFHLIPSISVMILFLIYHQKMKDCKRNSIQTDMPQKITKKLSWALNLFDNFILIEAEFEKIL